MGTRLQFCTAFHPHLDGHNERTSQTLEIILRVYVLGVGGSWYTYLPLAGFRASLAIMPVGQRELGSTEIVRKTKESIEMIRERLWTTQRRQKKSCTDKQRSGLEFHYHRGKVYSDSERGASSALARWHIGLSYIQNSVKYITPSRVSAEEIKTECRLERETKTLQNKKIGLVKAHLEYRKGVKKIEKGLRALCHLVKLVMISTVRSASDHRGSIVVAFLTQGKIVKKTNQGVGRPVPATSGRVPSGRLKGRAWLEVPIFREAQFRLV
ncbi:hypothetical protein OSB04_003285, partial [Centaurea solstitialis]